MDNIEDRITHLLSRLTLEQKIGQMNQVHSKSVDEEELRAGLVGSIIFASGAWAGNIRDDGAKAEACNQLQKLAMEQSPGIPLLFARDVIHGHRTVFPIPLAQAASWDCPLVRKAAAIAAREAAADGLAWTFTPMLDIARDPRWGRIAEGAGEDPYLGAAMAAAAIPGYQGETPEALTHSERIVACAKHYIGYGAAEGGRDYNTVELTERTLRDIYLPPFQAAVEAGVGTVMASFNEIGGMPVTASGELLTDLLKHELGFQGFVVSDWGAVHELMLHGVAGSKREAARLAVLAGIDMDMVSRCFIEHMPALVREGLVPEERIDDAVRRILRIKLRLGLFERPYTDVSQAASVMLTTEHRQCARELATRSMVLLKNEQQILPLGAGVQKIAVAGPLAEARGELFGTWTLDGREEDAGSILEGIRAVVPDREVIACGWNGEGMLELARAADVVLAIVGEHPSRSGEAKSISTLDLPAGQLELLQALKATGVPLVVVVLAGRPLSIGWIQENADAVLLAWHPGVEGGGAVADLLLGRSSPTGKLPVSIPRSAGQIPIYYNHKATGRPLDGSPAWNSRYIDLPRTPLHPFGFGLSYTTFSYSDLLVSPQIISGGGEVRIQAVVQNTGRCAGEEIVQLYVRDEVGSVSRPVKELKGFQRVQLQPGERRSVEFVLSTGELAFTRRDLTRGVEPGRYQVWIGPDSAHGLEGDFQIT